MVAPSVQLSLGKRPRLERRQAAGTVVRRNATRT